MTLPPFPADSRMRWRRIDVPGNEEAHVEHTIDGWRLTGALEVEETDVGARLRYAIDCDTRWHTRSASIEGTANGRPVRVTLAADGRGGWSRDGKALPALAGAKFTARLDTDAFGRVLLHEGLWVAELTEPRDVNGAASA
ncbi:MAG TPA: putative glycolipid-binding domain-containing protein [Gemmatimonadaceae bacterium]|nr:putative glycolipid-binding domain-containing protein [Gemmatimonadaceae bacterium]